MIPSSRLLQNVQNMHEALESHPKACLAKPGMHKIRNIGVMFFKNYNNISVRSRGFGGRLACWRSQGGYLKYRRL